MLDLFTVVWAKADIWRGMADVYRDLCLPALMQPDNIPAAAPLIGSYTIYACDLSEELIKESPLYRAMEKLIPVRWVPLQNGYGDVNSNTLHQMHLSKESGNHMLIASPDWVFGNGSIRNMANLCVRGAPWAPLIVFGFPKVSPGAFDIIKNRFAAGETLSNRQLVALLMTYGGGAPCNEVIQQDKKRWIVSHRIPTPCIRPDTKIIEFYSENDTPNQGYDHALPYWMIDQGYPWYYIPSSDVFFLIEEAEAWVGLSGPWGLELLSQGDAFFRQFTQRWQGEELISGGSDA